MPFLIFPSLGPVELLIIPAIIVVLFGATRVAGIGKGVGRAIREFRQELRASREENLLEAGSSRTDTGEQDLL